MNLNIILITTRIEAKISGEITYPEVANKIELIKANRLTQIVLETYHFFSIVLPFSYCTILGFVTVSIGGLGKNLLTDSE